MVFLQGTIFFRQGTSRLSWQGTTGGLATQNSGLATSTMTLRTRQSRRWKTRSCSEHWAAAAMQGYGLWRLGLEGSGKKKTKCKFWEWVSHSLSPVAVSIFFFFFSYLLRSSHVRRVCFLSTRYPTQWAQVRSFSNRSHLQVEPKPTHNVLIGSGRSGWSSWPNPWSALDSISSVTLFSKQICLWLTVFMLIFGMILLI